ncbi:unnamed protein product, partial [Ceratitis capitata]
RDRAARPCVHTGGGVIFACGKLFTTIFTNSPQLALNVNPVCSTTTQFNCAAVLCFGLATAAAAASAVAVTVAVGCCFVAFLLLSLFITLLMPLLCYYMTRDE